MEWLEVLRRIEGGEGERTEFKRGLGDLKEIGKAICAFANTQGGLIVLGVDDTGRIVGVKDPREKVQERLTDFLQTGCSVPVSAELGRHEDPGGWVHWISIPRHRGLEPMQYSGRVLVRRARSSAPPSPAEHQELNNAFGFVLTEEQVIRSAGIGDIDLASFRGYLRTLGIETEETPQPVPENDLRNRGVLSGERDPYATLYGLLAFGKEPQRHPHCGNCWVECVAYRGLDRASDVLLVGEAKGRLDEQVERAAAWVGGLLGHVERYRHLQREDIPLIPEVVLREALVNAVTHREYSITGSRVLLEVFKDRVVITSPGALPNHMRPESVLAGGLPRSRNESMANFMLVMGKMEKRGRGWPIMRSRMQEFNGTEPVLQVDEESRFVRVSLIRNNDDGNGAHGN